MLTVDFNSDLGESFGLWERGADDSLMEVISSANLACGFHAGDPVVMRSTVAKAREHGVAIGAHPGLPDLLGFGRRSMEVSPAELHDYVLYQLGALDAFVRTAGLRMHHVKPHGALYTAALDDAGTARSIAEAVAEFDGGLAIYTLAGSEMWHAAGRVGLNAVSEFFADRPIRRDGTVVMFRWSEEFQATPEAVAGRAVSAVTTGRVASLEGDPVEIDARTVCVHSDTPGAAAIGRAVSAALMRAGVRITAELPLSLQSAKRR